jgi:hypothetical protein
VISGTRSNDAPFSEKTVTQIVNAHGALIQLREPVLIGQKIMMNNVSTNEEIECSVVDISKGNTIPEVGLAFVDPAPHFWRVSFPQSPGLQIRDTVGAQVHKVGRYLHREL